jgi:hypothetical protein
MTTVTIASPPSIAGERAIDVLPVEDVVVVVVVVLVVGVVVEVVVTLAALNSTACVSGLKSVEAEVAVQSEMM